MTEIERPKGQPIEKKDEVHARERETSWSHELMGEGANEKERGGVGEVERVRKKEGKSER